MVLLIIGVVLIVVAVGIYMEGPPAGLPRLLAWVLGVLGLIAVLIAVIGYIDANDHDARTSYGTGTATASYGTGRAVA